MSKNFVDAWLIGLGRIGYSLEEDKLRIKPCTHLGGVTWANQFASKKNHIYISKFIDSSELACENFSKFLKKNPQVIKSCTKDYSITTELDDFETKPDLAIIATSTASHFGWLLKLIKMQVGKIVIEKPVVQSKDQRKKIIKALKKSSTKIFINYERRRHVNYRNLKKLLGQQKYGKVLSYNGVFASNQEYFFANKNYEGSLLHDTTHLVDIAMYLFGEVSSVDKLKYTKDSAVSIINLTHNSIRGEIKTINSAKYFKFDLKVYCEQAVLEIGNGYFNMQRTVRSNQYSNFHELSKPVSLAKKYTTKFNPFTQLYFEVTHSDDDSKVTGHIFEALKNIDILIK